jgi:hypothetical protein
MVTCVAASGETIRVGLAPVFIVGSPRSGTSILVAGLLASGYDGFHEGNFLSLLQTVARQVDRHFEVFGTNEPRVLMAQIDKEALKRSFHEAAKRMVEALHPTGNWVDKTGNPDMIQAIPILRALWPGSRFVFAKRRAIENVLSRLRKFPAHNFDFHCADWARNMAAWREARVLDPDLPGIEIDQWEISHEPTPTAHRLARFLGLTPEAAARMAEVFIRDRPQETRPGTADRVLSLAETGWNPNRLRLFQARCGAEMAAYGYTMDARYRLPSAEDIAS